MGEIYKITKDFATNNGSMTGFDGVLVLVNECIFRGPKFDPYPVDWLVILIFRGPSQVEICWMWFCDALRSYGMEEAMQLKLVLIG